MQDDLAQGLQVGTVLAHRVGALGQVGGAGALEQHRVGEPLDLVGGEAGSLADLLD